MTQLGNNTFTRNLVSCFSLYIFTTRQTFHPLPAPNLENLDYSLIFIRKLEPCLWGKTLTLRHNEIPVSPFSSSFQVYHKKEPSCAPCPPWSPTPTPFFPGLLLLGFFPFHTLPAWGVHRVGFIYCIHKPYLNH